MAVGAGNVELIGLQVLVEDHLPGVGALHPQVVGHLTLGGEQPADLGTNIVDPVHASRAPSTPLPACAGLATPAPISCRFGAQLNRGAMPGIGFSPDLGPWSLFFQ